MNYRQYASKKTAHTQLSLMFNQASFASATSLRSTAPAIARLRASMPCPVTAEISKNGIAFSSATARTAGDSIRVLCDIHLLATTNIGFARQIVAEAGEFLHNHVEVMDRIAPLISLTSTR